MPMNPEIKRRWVEALRSGKYKQGEPGFLLDYEGGYCCLGVLQGLIEPENIRGHENYDSIPTASCVRKAGLPKYRRDRYGVINAPENGIVMRLAKMNDGEDDNLGRASFKEIADFIEENL